MEAFSVIERRPVQVSEMMQRLGIEPGGAAAPRFGLSYATAFRRCASCACKQECREWLDSMPLELRNAPRFCPVADILFELSLAQPGQRETFGTNNCAHIADLERFEDEIDDLLAQKSVDDPAFAGLKRRKLHLQDEIAWLRHCNAERRRAG